MAVVVGTAFQGLQTGGEAASVGQPIRGTHWRRVESDEHMSRAKLRKLWSWGDGFTTTSGSYATVADEVPIRLSKSSSASIQVTIIGDNIDVLVVEAAAGPGGVISITAAAGPTSASLASAASGGGLASDTTTHIRFSAKRNGGSGTGELTAVIVHEVTHDSTTIT